MVFLIAILILLSCYVSVSDMEDDYKTTYFAVVGILSVILIVFNVIF